MAPRTVVNTKLGLRVYQLRRELGWSQGTVSQHMNAAGHTTWTHTTTGMIESGTRHLRLYEGYSLAAILRVSMKELAFGAPETDVEFLLARQMAKLTEERRTLLARVAVIDKLLMAYVP